MDIGGFIDSATGGFYSQIEGKLSEASDTLDSAHAAAQKANSLLAWWSDPVHLVLIIAGVLLANVLLIRWIDANTLKGAADAVS